MALGCAPIQFGPDEAIRFGWYHAPVGKWRRSGVVICNPIGDDYVRAHRPLRHLAERLAAAGFAVLRFDFHGTGDSSGTERDPGRVAAWRADVGLAVDELRARASVASIAIVGLRLGATLAMAAAAARPVESLVLWSPFASGAAFVNETTRLHQMHKLLEPQSFAAEPSGWSSGGAEALGFLLTPETVADLRPIDLLTVDKRPAARTLVIGTANLPQEQKLLAHLRALGDEPDYQHLAGQRFLMQIPHKAELPTAVLTAIVEWLSQRHPVDETDPPRVEPRPARRAAERPMVFGDAHPLFGILAQPPLEKRVPDRPAVLMLNAGAVHRIGPHRFYVPMARRWAELGFSVLRMDLSGIGDSPAVAGQPENVTYPHDGVDDIVQAMNALERAGVARRFVIVGLCSGGDLAFQLGLRDERVAGAVMINPRTFCVNDLEMVESYNRARWYQDSLFRAASWKKALRGQVDFGRALRMVLPKARDLVKWRAERMLGRFGGARAASASGGAPEETDVPGCLRLMAERGVDTFLVVGEKDPGIDYVDVRFGDEMRALSSVTGYRREDIAGTDHTFTSLFAQARVSDLVTEHLAQHHLAGAAAVAVR
jgi:dienelactone hydrolase